MKIELLIVERMLQLRKERFYRQRMADDRANLISNTCSSAERKKTSKIKVASLHGIDFLHFLSIDQDGGGC